MPGCWFLMDSRVMLVMELVSSRARSTRCSGVIFRNNRIRERGGGPVYPRVRIWSTCSLGRRIRWVANKISGPESPKRTVGCLTDRSRQGARALAGDSGRPPLSIAPETAG